MPSTADRVRAAATLLFAERGYEGTSVRAICADAGANLNAVSYHFGGKRALYVAVLQGIGEQRLASAQRILGSPAQTRDELRTKLELFAEETLAAWLTAPELLRILFAEAQQGFRTCEPDALASLARQSAVLVDFLSAAQRDGLLRAGVDLDIVAGALQERLNNQVIYLELVQSQYGRSISDPDYRRHWTRQTIDLLLHGAAAQE